MNLSRFAIFTSLLCSLAAIAAAPEGPTEETQGTISRALLDHGPVDRVQFRTEYDSVSIEACVLSIQYREVNETTSYTTTDKIDLKLVQKLGHDSTSQSPSVFLGHPTADCAESHLPDESIMHRQTISIYAANTTAAKSLAKGLTDAIKDCSGKAPLLL